MWLFSHFWPEGDIDQKQWCEDNVRQFTVDVNFGSDPTLAEKAEVLREQLESEGRWIGQREKVW